MKSGSYKNFAFRSLCLFAVAMALAIQPLSAQARSFTVLYSFTNNAVAGEHPSSPLVRDPKGNLYGVALGGTFGRGIIFKREPQVPGIAARKGMRQQNRRRHEPAER